MKNELHDFVATIRHQTEKAWLLDDGEHESFWAPKSLIEDNGDDTFTAPVWWLQEKGLI